MILDDYKEYMEDIIIEVYEKSNSGLGSEEVLSYRKVIRSAVFPLTGEDYKAFQSQNLKMESYKLFTNYDIPSNETKGKINIRVNLIVKGKNYNKKSERTFPTDNLHCYIIEVV